MTLILAVTTMLLALLTELMWSVMRKQDAVIQSLATRESYLVCEADRLRTDNEKLYRWLRVNGEFVIDEMALELDVLPTVRQTNRDSYRRQLYLFNCLSLMAIGYWEPMALTDVSRSPGCMVNMGGFSLNLGKTGMGTAKKDDKQVNGAFYHVHWYKYPLTSWLSIITSAGCLQGGDMDIAYLSEIDPTWVDSSLTTILNPEAVLFANPIAQGACAADAIASAFNKPLDILFWCAGSQGSMYPFSGWVSNESSPLQSSLLLSERMAYKLHRQGQILETVGADVAVCYEYPSPIIPKERWRYQMVNMYPDSAQCHPLGRTVTRWEVGKNPPVTRKNFGYLMWRKRNCVY